jgi:hypothetical protein
MKHVPLTAAQKCEAAVRGLLAIGVFPTPTVLHEMLGKRTKLAGSKSGTTINGRDTAIRNDILRAAGYVEKKDRTGTTTVRWVKGELPQSASTPIANDIIAGGVKRFSIDDLPF